MSDTNSQFNTSEQVERIREILVGRQLGSVEERLTHIEGQMATSQQPDSSPAPTNGEHPDPGAAAFADAPPPAANHDSLLRLQEMQNAALEQTAQLQRQVHAESELRQQQAEAFTKHIQHLHHTLQTITANYQQQGSIQAEARQELESVTTQMASHIDVRLREILQHLQSDILGWRNQMDRELQSMRQAKVDHSELRSRLAKIASAAMAEDPTPPPEEGFLL